jgi:hypothetical protein
MVKKSTRPLPSFPITHSKGEAAVLAPRLLFRQFACWFTPHFTVQIQRTTLTKRKQPATLPNPTHPSPSLSQTRAMPILDLKTHPQHPDLAGFHQLVDVNQHRRWAFLFIVIGMNPLAF